MFVLPVLEYGLNAQPLGDLAQAEREQGERVLRQATWGQGHWEERGRGTERACAGGTDKQSAGAQRGEAERGAERD